MSGFLEYGDNFLDSEGLKIALKEFKDQKGGSYPESYKKETFEVLNSELKGKDVSSSNILEIVQLLKEENPDDGSFCYWSELDALEQFAKRKPEEAAESFRNLLYSEEDLEARITSFRDAVQQNSDEDFGVYSAGAAYVLAAFDVEKFVPYNGEAYNRFVNWFSTDYDVPGSVSDKLVQYYDICEVVREFATFESLLSAQDLIYSSTKYDELQDKIPLLYIWKFTKRWNKFSNNTELFLDNLEELPLGYLESKRDHYSDDEENVNEIRFKVLDELINGENVSESDLEEFKSTVNSKSETNVTNSWNNFSILGQIYIDFFQNFKKNGDNGLWNYLTEKVKQDIEYEDSKAHVVDFTGAQHFMDREPWIALYPKKYETHREAPQIFLQFQEQGLRYGSTEGDRYEGKNIGSDYDYQKDESQVNLGPIIEKFKRVKSTIQALDQSSEATVWIEKSYVSNREDRLEGDRKVGKALWSPQEKKDESNSVYYDNLKTAEPGDVVIHLDQNTRDFIGVSKVKDTFNETKVLENTQWDNVGVNEMGYDRGERPCYLVELEGYKEFENHIDVNKVFNEENSRLLDQLDEKHSGLVFNKNYNLNQGAYLTKTPKELVKLIEEAYKEENQGSLPYLNSFSISEEGNMTQIKDNPAEYEKEIEVDKELSVELNLEFDDLYFPEDESKSIKKQIEASLNSGKHIIFTGPPGTGKTVLAEKVAEEMESKDENVSGYQLTTATSDWSTFDTVGGYRPKNGEEGLEFKPGHILRRFKDEEEDLKNEALVIDEINRANIDKAFGQLFTVLSGQKVQLPFTKGETEKEVEVVPGGEFEKPVEDHEFEKPVEDHEFVVPESWRILATMNTYDKTSLYEMSYAFMRRFSFIRIEAPDLEDDNRELMKGYLDAWELEDLYSEEDNEIDLDDSVEDVAEMWKRVNNAVEGREIGPAIAKDMIEFLDVNGSSREVANTAAITNFIFPQLEGVPDRKKIVGSILGEGLDLDENRLKSTAGSMLQVEFDGEK